MRAIVLNDGELKVVENHPLPEPPAGEALVRVLMAGICNTDLELIKGYQHFEGVPGHEFVGVVELIRGFRRDLIGKRVVGEINCGCGVCPYCMRGLARHCAKRTTLGIAGRDGAFAEYLVLPAGNLHVVPDHLADEEAVFVEPLAAAFEVLEQAHVKPDDRVLVLGDGKLGLLISMVLVLHGGDVTLLGRHENKMDLVKGAGVRTFLWEDFEAEKGYDLVVEATGSPDGFDCALRCVRPRGVVVLKTTTAGGKEMNLAPLVIDEVTVVGSRCGPFGPALRALGQGTIAVKGLVSSVYSFGQAQSAFVRAADKDVVKVLLDFRQE